MPDDVEVEPAARDLVEVKVGKQDLLAVTGGPGQDLPERPDDSATASDHDIVRRVRERVGCI
jgi:hypothetical protein